MKLNLKRPIVFFDLETTGVNVATDRIVELSYIKVFPDGSEESKTMRINPGMPIPPQTTAVHGISDEDVKDCPSFKDLAKELGRVFRDCDMAGFNSNKFDVPLLVEEFLRCGEDIDLRKTKFVDVQNIFHKMERRSLVAAYKFYCDKDLENAHSAMADTRATLEVLEAQLDRYTGELSNDVDFLSKFSTVTRNVDFAGRIVLNDKDEEVFNFGKHKGRRVADVLRAEPGYYSWMMQGDFPLDTKQTLTRIHLKEFGAK
jgi:DNA polymerase-3 subunit epsilon